MSQLAPIVLFVFRRPEHTARVLESLSLNEELAQSELHIYCEGPRNDADVPMVEATRLVVRNQARGGKVRIVEREHNLGCAASIIAGIDEVLTQHDRIIVLEDDLVVSRYFLEYMNAALDRYSGSTRIMHISGYMIPNDFAPPGSALVLPLTSSWGWATWRRAWSYFDRELSALNWLDKWSWRVFRFDILGAYPYRAMISQYQRGEIDAWDIRWYLGVFRVSGQAVFPGRSLVANIGFDSTGTHQTSEGMTESPDAVRDRRIQGWPAADSSKIRNIARLSSTLAPDLTWNRRLRKILRAVTTKASQGSFKGVGK